MSRPLRGIVPLLVAGITCSAASLAQCNNVWLPGEGVPGTNGPVERSVVWDPDGAGPATEKVVAAGFFTLAGNVLADQLALWDPASAAWSTMGSHFACGALAAAPSGELVASYSSMGGATAYGVVRWNGISWVPLGTGMDATVTALQVLPNGNVVAGGHFTTAGGVAANGIAQWNGITWSPLGSGVGAGGVLALATLTNGDLIAGGFFTSAGGVAANCVARWDGTNWSPLGAGVDASVRALAMLSNGDLVVGGDFNSAGGAAIAKIARWDGTGWSALVGGCDFPVYSLSTLPNGDLVAGGDFTLIWGTPAQHVARWNGSSWNAMGSGTDYPVRAVAALANGDVIAGGTFLTAGGVPALRIARWDGSTWHALGSGTDNGVSHLAPCPNGDVVAAGGFRTIGGVAASHVARWNGSSWSPLPGLSPLLHLTRALTVLPNGDVLLSSFDFALNGNFIWRWDGATWSTHAPSTGAAVREMVTLPNGDVVGGGSFTTIGGVAANRIARWNGTSWSPLGSGLNGQVLAVLALPNGDLLAGGVFTTAGGGAARHVARWDGASWSPVGSGLGTASGNVRALTLLANGDVVAAGGFADAGGITVNNIARWDGASWSALGSGIPNVEVEVVIELPNGDFIAGGFAINGGGDHMLRWDGTSWSPIGSGVGGNPNPTNNVVGALAPLPNGDVMVAGAFASAGGFASANLARLTTSCPASVQPLGAGCTSSGGSNMLSATLPWTGSTWRADATGLPIDALVCLVTGFQTISLPLVSVFSTAQPGCALHVQPDYVGLAVTSIGAASEQIVLPNTTALAGIVFHHQMVPIALDGTLAITATNALRMVVGSF